MANNLIYQYFLPYGGPMKNTTDWADLGVESAKKYAKAIGVKYEFSNKATMNAPNQNLESCRIFLDDYFNQFDKVLLLDVDILINTTENIFDEDVEDIGMVQDRTKGAFVENIISKMESYGNTTFVNSKSCPNEKRYCNGGVQLWSKEGRLKARERFGGLPEIYRYREATKMNEQPYINLMFNLHNIKVTELSNQWNRMYFMWKNNKPDGKFNHFLALHKNRMKEYV